MSIKTTTLTTLSRLTEFYLVLPSFYGLEVVVTWIETTMVTTSSTGLIEPQSWWNTRNVETRERLWGAEPRGPAPWTRRFRVAPAQRRRPKKKTAEVDNKNWAALTELYLVLPWSIDSSYCSSIDSGFWSVLWKFPRFSCGITSWEQTFPDFTEFYRVLGMIDSLVWTRVSSSVSCC